jgi:hypothetical protein
MVAKIARFLFVVLMSICSVVQAETWLGVGGGSVHLCHACGYNNFNPGLGIQQKVNTDLRLLGGVYYNSYYKTTVYAGAGYQPWQYGVIRFGVMGVLVTNYDHLQVPIIVLPALSIEGNRIGVDILGFPSIGSKTGLITANLKFKL